MSPSEMETVLSGGERSYRSGWLVVALASLFPVYWKDIREATREERRHVPTDSL